MLTILVAIHFVNIAKKRHKRAEVVLTASCSKALLDVEGGGTGTYDLVISGIVSDNTDQTPLEGIRLSLDYRLTPATV